MELVLFKYLIDYMNKKFSRPKNRQLQYNDKEYQEHAEDVEIRITKSLLNVFNKECDKYGMDDILASTLALNIFINIFAVTELDPNTILDLLNKTFVKNVDEIRRKMKND